MQYYVMKTGMEMFDACRAYGLGLILDALKDEGEKSTVVSDLGIYYLVEGAEIEKANTKELPFITLFENPNLAWNKVFLTIRKTSREKNIKKVKETLTNKIHKIIGSYKKFTLVEASSKGETLYQSMDLAATKGYRVPIRIKASYSDGSNLKIPIEHWALAALGEAHFSVWRGGKALVFIIPQPEKVKVMHWRDIKNRIDQKNVSRVSTTTTLAHIATLLTNEIRKKKISRDPFIDRFSSLIYGAMTKTGNQWKPASGGIFPLDYLYSLMESDLEISGEIFEMWDHVFKIGNRKGCEDISLSLSEFIPYPTIDNLENYLKIHLRYLLYEDIAYSNKGINEVLKNVGS